MNKKVFFGVAAHGYELPPDGFGVRGVALETKPGASARVKVKRLNIAERLYRVTGQGVYRDTVLLGRKPPVAHPLLNAEVTGQDGNGPLSGYLLVRTDSLVCGMEPAGRLPGQTRGSAKPCQRAKPCQSVTLWNTRDPMRYVERSAFGIPHARRIPHARQRPHAWSKAAKVRRRKNDRERPCTTGDTLYRFRGDGRSASSPRRDHFDFR
jgi:hypothetical protein